MQAAQNNIKNFDVSSTGEQVSVIALDKDYE